MTTMPADSPTPGPLRALALLGSSSIFTVFAGVVSTKIAALMIGREGVGLMALVLSVVAVANIAITAGVGQSMVRLSGATAPGGSVADPADWVAASRRIVMTTSIGLVAAALLLARFLAEPLFGPNAPVWWVPAVALGTCCYSWAQLQISTLVAYHLVRGTARVAMATAFVSPTVNAVAFGVAGLDGVVPGMLVANFGVAMVATVLTRRAIGSSPASGDRQYVRVRVRRLLRDGVPLVPVALLGSVSILTLLLIVDRMLSREEVGLFRAASTLSLGYMVLISASVSQDFFPRLSRLADDRDSFSRACDEQIRLVLYLSGPIVACLHVVMPLAIRVLFSSRFGRTTEVLEWQVVGDIVRLVSVVLATAVLVRRGGLARIAPEVFGAVAMVCLSVLGLHIFDFRGLGLGYLAAYLVYATALLVTVRRTYVLSRQVVGHLLVTLACVLVVPVLIPVLGGPTARVIGVVPAVFLVWRTVTSLGGSSLLLVVSRRGRPKPNVGATTQLSASGDGSASE